MTAAPSQTKGNALYRVEKKTHAKLPFWAVCLTRVREFGTEGEKSSPFSENLSSKYSVFWNAACNILIATGMGWDSWLFRTEGCYENAFSGKNVLLGERPLRSGMIVVIGLRCGAGKSWKLCARTVRLISSSSWRTGGSGPVRGKKSISPLDKAIRDREKAESILPKADNKRNKQQYAEALCAARASVAAVRAVFCFWMQKYRTRGHRKKNAN
jgi:hypothetical protein